MDSQKTDALSLLYQKHFGENPARITCLKGDGSDREVYRISCQGLPTVVGIYGPNPHENDAFVSFSRSFYQAALPVPRILSYDKSQHIYLEDDLGDVTLFHWYENLINSSRSIEAEPTYKKVLSQLLKFQVLGKTIIDYNKCYQFSTFQKDAIHFDLDFFYTSFLNRFASSTIDQQSLKTDFSQLVDKLLYAKSDYFLYRDFQSRNIMLHNDDLYFIDYQSGRKGALQYDVASLLFDANLRLDDDLRESLLHYYIESAREYEGIDPKEFKDFYFDFALVRMLQALAAFSHLALDKGKTYFLRNIPIALENISTLLTKNCLLNELKELKRLFTQDLLVNAKFQGTDML